MSRDTTLALIAITAAALALRLLWLANTDTETPFLSDPQYYHATAANIADGRGYSVRVDDAGFGAGAGSEATAFWAPGYSALIAVPYALFGDDVRWAKMANALAGALTCLPVFFIGRRLWRGDLTPVPSPSRGEGDVGAGAAAQSEGMSRDLSLSSAVTPNSVPLHMRGEGDRAPVGAGRGKQRPYRADVVGLLAAAIVAVMPGLIYWTPALFADGVFTFGVACTLALAAWASERRSIGAYVAVGVALTATAFVRSQGVLLIVPVAVLVVPSLEGRSAARALAPIAAALLLGIVPWAVRNEQAMGEPYLISDNVCYNLRGAHAPYSTGTSVAIQDLWDEAPGISFKERELLFDDLGCERAWAYAREHPGRELELAAKRVGWLLRSDAAPAVRWSETLGATPLRHGDRDLFVRLGDIAWYATLALAALSPLFIARTRMAWALWTLIGVWLAMHLVFHGEPRYHLPMIAALAPLAAAVAVSLALRAGAWGGAAVDDTTRA